MKNIGDYYKWISNLFYKSVKDEHKDKSFVTNFPYRSHSLYLASPRTVDI